VQQPSPLYKRYRFPGELISHAVWLYYRFLLSYRDVEELLAERRQRRRVIRRDSRCSPLPRRGVG
jgi:transposase-like protein